MRAALAPEQALLGSLAIGGPPDELLSALLAACDPLRLVGAAQREGLAGALYANLARGSCLAGLDGVPRAELAAAYRRNAALYLARRRALVGVLGALRPHRVRVIVLKGMALLESLYDDPGMRPLGDIDVWVAEADRAVLEAALSVRGFAPEPFYPGTYRSGNTSIDIHTHLLGAERIRSRRAILAAGQTALLAQTLAVDYDGAAAERLAPAPELLFLCLHLLKHNADRLIWLLEINELAARCNAPEWERLLELAELSGQGRALRQVAFLAGRLLPEKITPRLASLARATPLGAFERRVLSRRARRGRLPIWGPLLFFSTHDGIMGRLAAAFETLFPRPVILRQIFRDTRTSLWRLYCRRVGQLVVRVLR